MGLGGRHCREAVACIQCLVVVEADLCRKG